MEDKMTRPKREAGEAVAEFLAKCKQRDYHGEGSLFIGIDPGTTGAIAFVYRFSNGQRACCVEDIPSYTIELASKKKCRVNKKTGKRLPAEHKTRTACDPTRCRLIFENVKPLIDRVKLLLEETIIKPTGAFKTSMITIQSTSASFHMWPMYLMEIGVSFQTIPPADWKEAYGISHWDKDKVLRAARQKFSGVDLSLAGDHNRAEALCLADYLADLDSGSITGFAGLKVPKAKPKPRKKKP